MSELNVHAFAPLDESRARETIVRFGNECLDKLVARFGYLALLHQRVAPVAISSFAIRIDLNRAREPFTRFLLIGTFEIDVADEQRCFIKIWIEQQRLLIHLYRFRKIAFGES